MIKVVQFTRLFVKILDVFSRVYVSLELFDIVLDIFWFVRDREIECVVASTKL